MEVAHWNANRPSLAMPTIGWILPSPMATLTREHFLSPLKMKYKEAKQVVIKDFKEHDMFIDFGWKFRWYTRLRKQIKEWAEHIQNEG